MGGGGGCLGELLEPAFPFKTFLLVCHHLAKRGNGERTYDREVSRDWRAKLGIVENSTHQLRNGVWTGGNLH